MRHTNWTDQCCSTLQQDREYETDTVLVGLIRLHILARRLGDIIAGPGSSQTDLRNAAVLEIVMRSFQQEYAQIEANISSSPSDLNCLLPGPHSLCANALTSSP